MKSFILVLLLLSSSSCMTGLLTTGAVGTISGTATNEYLNGYEKTGMILLASTVMIPVFLGADILFIPFESLGYAWGDSSGWSFEESYDDAIAEASLYGKPDVKNISLNAPEEEPIPRDLALKNLKEVFTQKNIVFKDQGLYFQSIQKLIPYTNLNFFAVEYPDGNYTIFIDHTYDYQLNLKKKYEIKHIEELLFPEDLIRDDSDFDYDKYVRRQQKHKEIIHSLRTLGLTYREYYRSQDYWE